MKKPSNLESKQGKKNRDWWREKRFVWGRIWMMRDLIRITYCVVLQELNCQLCRLFGALSGRQISGYLLVSGSKTARTQIPLYCLFLVASFGMFLSMSCWLSPFLLQRLSGLDCWSSHWWYGINSRRSHSRLVRMVFVEQVDRLSKVLDRWGWLLNVFFFQISFLKYQVVEAW